MLSRTVVRAELERINAFRFESTIHGFEMQTMNGPWRLVHGGGISGNGDRTWWIERKDGTDKSRIVRSRRDLHKIVIEWLAGPRPMDRPGLRSYARLHSFRGTDSYQWFYRRTSK